MADFEFTVGATRPFFAVTIKSALTNAAVSLVGATVLFFWAEEKDPLTAIVDGGTVNVTSAADGECEYRWGASDLPRQGTYTAIFEVEHSDGKKQPVRIEGVVVKPAIG